MDKTLNDMQQWYDGYLFPQGCNAERMYNPDMVLYFAKDYARLRSDILMICWIPILQVIIVKYGVFLRLEIQEFESIEILNDLLEEGQVLSTLTRQYSFEREFNRADLISLYCSTMASLRLKKAILPELHLRFQTMLSNNCTTSICTN